jgi:hypothetical protein
LVVGEENRTSEGLIASTFTWRDNLPAFFAKHDNGRLSTADINEITATYGKNPQALADVLIELYGEDPRGAA